MLQINCDASNVPEERFPFECKIRAYAHQCQSLEILETIGQLRDTTRQSDILQNKSAQLSVSAKVRKINVSEIGVLKNK